MESISKTNNTINQQTNQSTVKYCKKSLRKLSTIRAPWKNSTDLNAKTKKIKGYLTALEKVCPKNQIGEKIISGFPDGTEERIFLVEHVTNKINGEAQQISIVLSLIRVRNNSKKHLNQGFRNFYEKFYSGKNWSEGVVNIMTAGLTSRLNELGTVRREKIGNNVLYKLTDQGETLCETLSSEYEERLVA